MTISAFFWLIALPLLASPLIYLFGRVGTLAFRRQTNGADNAGLSIARWIAIAVLVADWMPFALAAGTFAQNGPQVFTLGSVKLVLDGLSLLLAAVVLGLGALVTIFSVPYMANEQGEEKYYAMLVAMIGVIIALGCAGDLFNLWVWFEAMAVTSYLLVVLYKDEPASLEAGVKYLVQSATGSILILIAIALVLAKTGSLDLAEIRQSTGPSLAILGAGGLFVAGFGVKTALAPMHTWLPDAHTQAPSGISAMLSGVVIEAGLVAMLRALGALAGEAVSWGVLLMAFGAMNMLVGNLMALRQKQVKRLLAYSSLSHVGYMVVGLGIAMYAGQAAGAQGGFFHLLNHGLMKGLAFLAAGTLLYGISHMGAHEGAAGSHATLTIPDLNGAAQRYPLAALAFSLAVLGLGGLPPLAGFMSKWQIFVAGFATHNTLIGLLVIFAALNSVLSLGYYAPLVNAMYRKQPSQAVAHGAGIPLEMNIPLVVLSAGVILLGVWPGLVQWLTEPAGRALMSVLGG